MGKQFVFLFPEGSHTMEERWASGHIIQIYQWLTIIRWTESWLSYNPLYLAKLCTVRGGALIVNCADPGYYPGKWMEYCCIVRSHPELGKYARMNINPYIVLKGGGRETLFIEKIISK